jgi:MFS family permease
MTASGTVSLRAVTPSVFLPSMLYGLGQGAIAPVIALSALDLGASVAVASLAVAAIGIGQTLADIPAGTLTTRLGERRAMLLATVLVSAALVVCVLATTVWLFTLAIGLTGAAGAVWLLARQAYLTEAVAPHMRGRALATLGGVQRIGTFVGPFLGAGAMALGGTDAAYWTHIAAAAAGALLLLLVPDVTGRGSGGSLPKIRVVDIVREHRPVLLRLGTAVSSVGVVRAAWLAVIPIWGESLGLSPVTTSLVFGLSSAVDMLLFYPAGKVMDRFGRIWVAVPAMVVMGLGLIAVPFTSDVVTFALAAALMGLGNGMGSGIVMVLGSDASPAVGRASFLGVFRLCADIGQGAGPVILGGVTAVAGLATGVWAVGAVGLIGAGALWRWVPRTGRAAAPAPAPVVRGAR